jgi:hypothetical protein
VRSLLTAAFLCISACGWEVTLGAGDGIAAVTFEADVPNPAREQEGAVRLAEDVVVVSAGDSQRYLDRFGADKIGAIRGVSLELVSLRVDGVDLARAAPARITLGGHELQGVRGATLELDDDQVDDLRAAILGGTEMRLPLLIELDAPLEALDASRPRLHIVLVVQPTLRVDVESAL